MDRAHPSIIPVRCSGPLQGCFLMNLFICRCRCSFEQRFQLHDRPLRTVSVHPTETHYFVTAGVGG